MTKEWEIVRTNCVRAWLNDVRTSVSRARSIEHQMAQEKDSIDLLRAVVYSGQPGSSKSSPDRDIVAHISRINKLVSDMEIAYEEKHRLVREANSVFQTLESHHAASEVMSGRWIDGRSWKELSLLIGYSERRLHDIEKSAIVECYELMPHTYRLRIPRSDF